MSPKLVFVFKDDMNQSLHNDTQFYKMLPLLLGYAHFTFLSNVLNMFDVSLLHFTTPIPMRSKYINQQKSVIKLGPTHGIGPFTIFTFLENIPE